MFLISVASVFGQQYFGFAGNVDCHESDCTSFYRFGYCCCIHARRFSGISIDHEFPGHALFFLSGALFPLQGLPKIVEQVTIINPLSYGVDALRGLLTNNYHFGLSLDLLVLSGITLIFLLIGSYLFSRIEL